MAETIAVCAIVGGVIILAGRSFYRTLIGKNDQCGCGAKTCAASSLCDRLVDLNKSENMKR
jgi:hypothetical protein